MRYIIPMKMKSWNDTIAYCRSNKYGANNHKKREMKEVSQYIDKIPKIEKYPVKMTFRWHIKSVISDLDNKSVKSILDCMQELGILENDNIKHIKEIVYIAIPDKEDYVELEIEEYVNDEC